MTNIKEKIQELKNELSNMESIELELNKTLTNKSKVQDKIKMLLMKLEEKNSEIEKILGFSVTGMISSIFVDKKKTLEEKREEYYILSKEYENLKSESSTIQFEYDILNRKLIHFTKLKKELEGILDKREYELLHENSISGNTIRKITNELNQNIQTIEIIQSTIKLISTLLNKLTLLSASLQEIESLTSWSRHRVRGSSSQKRRAIAKAKEYNIECKLLLNNLDNSLRNINYSSVVLDINLLNFESFLGIFFDNIFSDIILQNKVAVALSDIERIYQKLKRIKRDLEQEVISYKSKSENLMKAKKNLLLE